MTGSITRRKFLAASAATTAFAAIAGPVFAQSSRARFIWWGSTERATRTLKAIEAFTAGNSGADVVGEYLTWSDYWPRLATQVAGRNAPDVIQMDYRYIFEYARREALAPLDDFLFDTIQIEDFGANNIDGGRVDGKLYGVNLGVNSVVMLYDIASWEKSGIEPPSGSDTWESFAQKCEEFGANKPRPGFFATSDAGGVEQVYENWLRQNGTELYNPDGTIGYTPELATRWYAMWQDMRERGACVPADVQALDQLDIETNPLTVRKSATAFAHSNQFVGYQAVNQAKLEVSAYPKISADAPSGHYLKPSMFGSISSQSGVKELGAQLISFLVADVEGARILGVERGVPPSARIREALAPDLDENARKVVSYIDEITKIAGGLPPPPPAGAGELQFTLKRINEQVGFGRVTPEQAGEELVREAEAVLARG